MADDEAAKVDATDKVDANDEADKGDKVKLLKDMLYEAVCQHGSDSRLFTQKDLVDLGVVPANDPILLLSLIQGLTDDKLLVASTGPTGICWRWRNREEAKKYTSLPNDETAMVYSVIDEAGADGIWNRTIKNRLNMHEAVVKNCIKYLETKGYIASMKNVEHPNKKMYIKANLAPSERATGGPWFTDGELDTAFIEELKRLVFEYIKTKSAYLGSQGGHRGDAASNVRAPKRGIIKGSGDSNGTRGNKRAATDMSMDEGANGKEASPVVAPRQRGGKVFLPLPAGYKKYPTVAEIARFINIEGITNNTTLSVPDVQQLVDVLYYDGLIEPVRVGARRGYRVTRPTRQSTVSFQPGMGLEVDMLGPEPRGNGLTEVPCGRCPVFELCGEGGPVSPSNCVYFVKWLDLEDAVEGAAKPTLIAAP
ncbi:DNA-directed RNA polymerase [Echria macrotheca]|uniref:DNA-directed RNA polymerase n=1 Tax=Echria macrotheca TaxID=438768 RepID=A0AAJ0F7D3_9PEZI|nr:DNA-directed RNA polymerase [Echria macrotheca]